MKKLCRSHTSGEGGGDIDWEVDYHCSYTSSCCDGKEQDTTLEKRKSKKESLRCFCCCRIMLSYSGNVSCIHPDFTVGSYVVNESLSKVNFRYVNLLLSRSIRGECKQHKKTLLPNSLSHAAADVSRKSQIEMKFSNGLFSSSFSKRVEENKKKINGFNRYGVRSLFRVIFSREVWWLLISFFIAFYCYVAACD